MNVKMISLFELLKISVRKEFENMVDTELRKSKIYLIEEFTKYEDKLAERLYDKFMEEEGRK